MWYLYVCVIICKRAIIIHLDNSVVVKYIKNRRAAGKQYKLENLKIVKTVGSLLLHYVCDWLISTTSSCSSFF